MYYEEYVNRFLDGYCVRFSIPEKCFTKMKATKQEHGGESST